MQLFVDRVRIIDFDSLRIEFVNEDFQSLIVENEQILCLIRRRNSFCLAIYNFFA
jgi:hypothetical protein